MDVVNVYYYLRGFSLSAPPGGCHNTSAQMQIGVITPCLSCRDRETLTMFRIVAIIIVVINLAACGVVSTVSEGLQQAPAVETDLEQSVGLKQPVSFNCRDAQ